MSAVQVEVLGRGGPERAGVVLLPDRAGADATARAYGNRLLDEGFGVALAWGWGARGGAATSDPEIPDALGLGAAAAGLAALRTALDREGADGGKAEGKPGGRPILVGFGAGGLMARLAGCALTGFGGVVSFGGRLVYPRISAVKPAQPLDLLPGLAGGLQHHAALRDPDVAEVHIAELEQRLSWRALPCQILRYDAAAGFWDPACPDYDPDLAELAWYRAVRFIGLLENQDGPG